MLLDFSSDYYVAWEQLNQLKKRLHHFAHQPITDSVSEKDSLERKTIEFIKQITIDAVEGGFYRIENKKYQVNTIENIILAEYLLVADKVFLSGEFIYLANRILLNIQKHLFNRQTSFCISQQNYSNNPPFKVSGNQLIKILDKNERQLLLAFLGQDTIIENTHYHLDYFFNIKAAADKSGLHYKQAQIIENTMQQKLSAFLEPQYHPTTNNSKNEIYINTQLLNTITQSIIWHNNKQFISLAEEVYQVLIKHLSLIIKQPVQLSIEKQVEICYSITTFNQINFNERQIKKVAEYFSQINISTLDTLPYKAQYELIVLCKIFSHFNLTTSPIEQFPPQLAAESRKIKIVTINNSASLLTKKHQLLEKYDTHLYLFTVN
ncbi:hypothetical protein [Aliikangiella sp. IMCC44359]|uniref:hypothetical protein n=1 Tax=Aliikangiella sp. IMCC44359 TaxID=3459125 RepID=UPI00403A9F1D